jgi:hypothetical protein
VGIPGTCTAYHEHRATASGCKAYFEPIQFTLSVTDALCVTPPDVSLKVSE